MNKHIHMMKNSLIRKLIIKFIFVMTMVLMVGACSACTLGSAASGSDFARLFLTRISEGEYDLAYSMIEPDEDITLEEFVDLYKTLFETLEISDVEFAATSTDGGDTLTSFSYSLTYISDICGPIQGNYRMIILKDSSGTRYIQWSPSLVLPEMEWGDTIRAGVVSASRGDILADGLAFATNESAIAVSVVVEDIAWSVFGEYAPEELSDEELALETEASRSYTEELIDALSRILELDRETVLRRMASPYNDVSLIGEYYPDELNDDIIQELESFDEIRVEQSSVNDVRYYPEGSALAHILGYVQYIDETQLEGLNAALDDGKAPYSKGDKAGYTGLEKEYENDLRGEDGYIVYVRTEIGGNRRTLYSKPATDGLDIQLTIDPDLQLRLEEMLSLSLFEESMGGAVVVMNPNTGAIDAIASYPTFNLNLFAAGISDEDFNYLVDNYNAPFYNRALLSAFPPGSTYKTMTAAAVLTYGILDPDYVFDGEIVNDLWTPEGYGTWIWPSIKRTEMRNRTEPLNMRNALLNSDNIYFANAALMLGDELMEEFWNELGLNETIDFELTVAASQYATEGSERNPKLVADSGYGQATMLATPLQLACTYCALANGGDVVVPYIVDGLYHFDENGDYVPVEQTTPRVFRENVIDRDVIDTITPMLCDVVDSRYNGTGQRLRVKNCVIAGKTGTAEVGNDKSREISWFVGFRTGVSEEDARLVLVALELPTEEDYSYIKFDIARDILEMSEPVTTPPAATEAPTTAQPTEG